MSRRALQGSPRLQLLQARLQEQGHAEVCNSSQSAHARFYCSRKILFRPSPRVGDFVCTHGRAVILSEAAVTEGMTRIRAATPPPGRAPKEASRITKATSCQDLKSPCAAGFRWKSSLTSPAQKDGRPPTQNETCAWPSMSGVRHGWGRSRSQGQKVGSLGAWLTMALEGPIMTSFGHFHANAGGVLGYGPQRHACRGRASVE